MPAAKFRIRERLLCAAAWLLSTALGAQTNDFATGNLHFDAQAMDSNGDRMISREEMIAYARKMWVRMANGHDRIAIEVATQDFASGGVNFKARAIDTDHDGSISEEEFASYAGRRFDEIKQHHNEVSVADMARAIASGHSSRAD